MNTPVQPTDDSEKTGSEATITVGHGLQEIGPSYPCELVTNSLTHSIAEDPPERCGVQEIGPSNPSELV